MAIGDPEELILSVVGNANWSLACAFLCMKSPGDPTVPLNYREDVNEPR